MKGDFGAPLLLIASRTSDRFATILLFAGFVVTGIVTTILGPILPVFIARWSLNDAQAGFFFTTQFAGSLAGVGLSSFLLAMRGYRTTLIVGYVFMAGGIAVLVSSNLSLVQAATAVYGAGFGLVIPATNLCIAEQAGAKSASTLSLLNLCWSIGSLSCPILILYGVRSGGLELLLWEVAGIACLFALSILFWGGSQPAISLAEADAKIVPACGSLTNAVLLGLLFFSYVGTESAMSGWAVAFSKRLRAGGEAGGGLAPMFFWTGLLVGRLLGPAILLRIKETTAVCLGLLMAGFGVAVFFCSYTRPIAMVALTITGAGLSLLYPIYISWLSQAFGSRARRIGGAMFAMAAAGGATLPWLVGILSNYSGSLRIGLMVPLAGCLLMFLLAVTFRRNAAV